MILFIRSLQKIFYGRRTQLAVFLVLLFRMSSLFAAPPFITNDADIAPYHRLDIYGDAQLFAGNIISDVFFPSVEFDYGLFHNVGLQLVVRYDFHFEHGQQTSSIGDTFFGVEYLFIEETKRAPKVAFFPFIIIPTGSHTLETGNGKPWYQLPIIVQKSWDKWTVFGELGVGINNAPDTENFVFAGLVAQRKVTEKFMLGLEIYSQGKASEVLDKFTVLNLGGTYQLSSNFAIYFSGGGSILGQKMILGSLGLYLKL
jgi:hypothetical protein